jgi:hypothetical protein
LRLHKESSKEDGEVSNYILHGFHFYWLVLFFNIFN